MHTSCLPCDRRDWHHESQVPSITHTYDAIRRPIGNATIAVTKACGKLTRLTDDEKELPFVKAHDEMVPHEVLATDIKKPENRTRRVWNGSARIEEQCQDALNLLRSSRMMNCMGRLFTNVRYHCRPKIRLPVSHHLRSPTQEGYCHPGPLSR